MEIDRSNGAGGFCCPTIDQSLMHEMAVLKIVHGDTCRAFNGIAGPIENTAGPAKVVWNETTCFGNVYGYGDRHGMLFVGRRFAIG